MQPEVLANDQWPTTEDRRLMPDTFQLEIVTPEKMVVKDVAEEMQIPGKNGYLGILPGHAPLITELAVGEISYRKSTICRWPGALPKCFPTR